VGGCDLAAVETVCAWQAETPTRSLLATLHDLVGKSLVRAELARQFAPCLKCVRRDDT
jgi:hypothetical protein